MAAWDAVNIASRFQMMYSDATDVLDTQYGQLHASRCETAKLIEDKWKCQLEQRYTDVALVSGQLRPLALAAIHLQSMSVDRVSSPFRCTQHGRVHALQFGRAMPMRIQWSYGSAKVMKNCGSV